MGKREFDRVREIALALPQVNERLSHGVRCFFVRDKRPVCYFHDDDFHGDGRVSLWCPAPAGVPEELVAAEPERFFRPTPSASRTFSDWLGVYVDAASDSNEDWDEVSASSGTHIVNQSEPSSAPGELGYTVGVRVRVDASVGVGAV